MNRRRYSSKPPTVVIEGVAPQVDNGRHAAKRVVGDVCYVGADIYKDGHDLLAARILVRQPGQRRRRAVPMTYDYDTDRWHASFALDRIGSWSFRVEAWPDVFATWRSALRKKVDAGLDVSLELFEGAEIAAAAANHTSGRRQARLREMARVLGDPKTAVDDRITMAFSPALQRSMAKVIDPTELTDYGREFPITVDREQARFATWYEMFPRSQGTVPGSHATFRDAERRLPHLADLGFDVIYLPPIHPIGHTFRKGRNNTLDPRPGDPGSPWAIGNEHGGHTAVEPNLGTLDDFDHFVDAARAAGLEIALDYALQCSPDHPWVKQHPDWFNIRPDGSIQYAENPPKRYQDIYPLNFWCPEHDGLWRACRDVLLFWIAHNVRIFRVDNPHTKPFAFWEWVIREVQRDHPDVIFFAEAFTRPKRMKGLAKLGFTQSYTYFTWKNSAAELRDYFTELAHPDMVEYFRGNLFTNTPDILHAYLQRGGRPAFRVRLLLAATLSPLYGIYSGFELCENEPREPGSEEYLNSEKFEIRVRDWTAPGNLNDDVRSLNRIRRQNRGLQLYGNLAFHHSDNDQVLFYSRMSWGNDILVAVNLDPLRAQETTVHVPLDLLSIDADRPFEVEDLLTGARYRWRGLRNFIRLDPAEQVGHVFRVVRPTV